MEVGKDALPVVVRGDLGPSLGGVAVLAVDRDEDVFDVGLLAADLVDPRGAGDVADEA